MEKLITTMMKSHKNELDKVYKDFESTHKRGSEGCNGECTTNIIDCKFLQLLCLHFKPKMIFEIGTWVGNTSYAMAFATKDIGTLIYTCDVNDRFLQGVETKTIEVGKRIHINPKTHSYKALQNYNSDKKIDFIFNDASLDTNTCQKIYDLTADEFIFATHDYYDSDGNHQKGWCAIVEHMSKILDENNAEYELYKPSKDWYPNGYQPYGVNSICALLIVKK